MDVWMPARIPLAVASRRRVLVVARMRAKPARPIALERVPSRPLDVHEPSGESMALAVDVRSNVGVRALVLVQDGREMGPGRPHEIDASPNAELREPRQGEGEELL